MTKTLPVSVIQKNLYDQLQASRDIFQIITALADVADSEPVKDSNLRPILENIMERLLDVGNRLSESANDTGKRLLQVAGAD